MPAPRNRKKAFESEEAQANSIGASTVQSCRRYARSARRICAGGAPSMSPLWTGSSSESEAEPYWFQKIEVLPGFYSNGWSNPALEKLPYFGLPERSER